MKNVFKYMKNNFDYIFLQILYFIYKYKLFDNNNNIIEHVYEIDILPSIITRDINLKIYPIINLNFIILQILIILPNLIKIKQII